MSESQPQCRWFHVTPDRVVLFLLVAECLIWLSNWLGWPAWHKGYSVLTCVAVVGAAVLLMLVWFAVALVFRWQFQFSIWTLLVLTIVVALPFSWFAVEVKRAREQWEAVTALENLGHDLRYDWQFDESGRCTYSERKLEPAWLVGLLGADFFQTVRNAYMHQDQMALSGLTYLRGLKELDTLMLYGAKIAEADLENLKGLNRLRVLNLRNSNITDAGLENLKGLKQLAGLSLTGTKVTDAGLRHLQGLTELEELWLNLTQVTDSGLDNLKGLHRLRSLGLVGTKVTDVGLERLKGLTQLEHLYLNGTEITDAGLENLMGLKRLEKLLITYPTKITKAGERTFHQVIPNCRIGYGEGLLRYEME